MTHDQIEAMTLADRVVVMEKGIVQQVGSLTEIQDRPANTFVACFIGSQAMNLMQGTDSGGTFSVQGTEINGILAPVGAMTLGFRAEVVESGGQINAAIYALELLGDATMVTVRLDGTLVSVRADKTFSANIGWSVSNSVPNEIRHLFDVQTGARIEA